MRHATDLQQRARHVTCNRHATDMQQICNSEQCLPSAAGRWRRRNVHVRHLVASGCCCGGGCCRCGCCRCMLQRDVLVWMVAQRRDIRRGGCGGNGVVDLRARLACLACLSRSWSTLRPCSHTHTHAHREREREREGERYIRTHIRHAHMSAPVGGLGLSL